MELPSKKNTKKQIISTNNGILIRRTFALNEFQFELRLLRTADGKFELLNTIPQNTVPPNTVPQNTVPQNTVPQNTVPQK